MIFKMVRSLPIIFFLTCVAVSSWSQYNFIHYSVNEGLPQSQVYCITEDLLGRLWIGTQGGGLSRYDGKEFIRFNTRNGLPNDYINALCTDEHGTIWIGTKKGLGFYRNGEFQRITTSSGVEPEIISLVLWDGVLFIGTPYGLLSYDRLNKRLTPKLDQILIDKTIYALAAYDNILLIGTNAGLGILDRSDSLHFITSVDGLYANQVTAINAFTKETAYIGTQNGGIQKYSEGKIIDLINLNETSAFLPRSLYNKDLNTLWVGTQYQGIGIYNFADSSWQTINDQSGLLINQVRTIYPDSWGNIWIGTSGKGMSKYLGRQFIIYNVTNGLPANNVYALEVDDNRIWLSTADKGISMVDNIAGIKWLGNDSLFQNVKCNAIVKDQHGLIWVGTDNRGIYVFHQDTLWKHIVEDGIANNNIKCMQLDSNGTIWVGTAGSGIMTIEKLDTFRFDIIKYLYGQGWKNTVVLDFHVDLRRRIWFCTEDGRIGLIGKDGISNIFSIKFGVPAIPLRSMIEDDAGRLIVATGGEGLIFSQLYTDSIQFQHVEQNQFNSLNMYSLIQDDNRRLWVGTERGVDRIQMDEIGNVIEHEFYGRDQGFLGIENYQDAAIKDNSGSLWFGTVNGLVKHNPSKFIPQSNPPRLKIQSINLFNESIQFDLVAKDTFPFDQNNFSFEFEGIQINKANEIRYQWRLKGYNESWTPPSNTQYVNYPNLPPGNYGFEVKACLYANNCSDPINYRFTILAPFWTRWWFFTGLGVFGAFLVFLLYRTRLKRLIIKEKQVEMEKKLIKLEQKALRLQMNPHFLFNALNSIQGLISSGESSEARKQISHFAKLMRSILTNSKVDHVSLHQELETLERYIKMEQFCRGQSFTYTFNIDPEIDTEEILIPSMVLQPFVENAIIHGLGNINYLGQLKIDIGIKGNVLECIIEDNGVGIEKSKSNKIDRGNNHISMGMNVTSERLKLMSKNKKLERVHIHDLSNQGDSGTRVTVNIPI